MDINARRTLFNTTDIAKLNADGTFETLNFGDFGTCSGDCVSIALQKICFRARSTGKYFPILRRHMEKSTDTNACNIAGFDASKGICLSGTNEKFCFCGFYGQKCDKGCPNSCSESSVENSRCNANTHSCTCPSTHTGLDCALLNCPTDSSNNICFNHGTCKLIGNEAKCECNPLYTGDDCSTLTILEKEADNGYPIATGLSGIEGMAFKFGWHFPSVLVAILIWLLILTPCCQGKLLLKNRDLSILLLSIINIIFILKLLVAFTAHVVAVKRDAVAGQRNGGAVKIKVYVPAGVAIHIANNMQLA